MQLFIISILFLVHAIVFFNPSKNGVLASKPNSSLAFSVEPNLLPEVSQVLLGNRSKPPLFPVCSQINSAHSFIESSVPEAILYTSPGVPFKAQAINPLQISSTYIKSLDASPPLKRGSLSPFKDL